MIEERDIPHAVELMDTVMSINAPVREHFKPESETDEESEEQAGLTDQQLLSIINQKQENSLRWADATELSKDRVTAEQYYNGEPLGNEKEGRSQVVSHDVAETVDNIMPDLMEIFASGDEVVEFEPQGKEDEEAAKQATDFVNYIFEKENLGFMILYTWFFDALLKRNGIVKVWYEERTNRTKEQYTGLPQAEIMTLKEDINLKFLEVTENREAFIEQDLVTGAPVEKERVTYDCVCARMTPEKKYCVDNVPPDEFFIESRCKSLESATFLGQCSKKSFADLMELGFELEELKRIPRGDNEDNQERLQRFKEEGDLPLSDLSDSTDETMRTVWVREVYMKCDYDGDGFAEWRKIMLAGEAGIKGIILDNEEVDGHPYADISSCPMPHKFHGRSIFDKTKAIQDIKTALWRGSLDAIYLANNPRQGIVEGQVNIDDLLNPRINGIVRMKNPNSLVPIHTQNASPQAFQMIEYADSVREQRTGVTRYNQGLDADSLNKTATGIREIKKSGDKRVRLIARIFAETGVKRLFQLLFKLACQHEDKERVIRLRGKWVSIDPRNWKTKMDLTVKVGIGNGSKEDQFKTAMALLELDQKIVNMQKGVKGPLVTTQHIYNKLSRIIEAVGWKSVDPYYLDPSEFEKEQEAKPKPRPQPTPDQQKDLVSLEMKKLEKLMKEMDMRMKQFEAYQKLGPAMNMIPTVPPPPPNVSPNLGAPVKPRPVMTTNPALQNRPIQQPQQPRGDGING